MRSWSSLVGAIPVWALIWDRIVTVFSRATVRIDLASALYQKEPWTICERGRVW